MKNEYDEEENRDTENNSYDGLAVYLREMARYPLLTRQEESDLLTKIRAGDDAARTRMIEANLRLVVNIAGSKYAGSSLLPDLISEGNIGLMHAVDTFNPAKGCRFATYATQWVTQRIGRALRTYERDVRLPEHVANQISKMKRAALELSAKLGREPSSQELADARGLSLAKCERLLALSLKSVSLDAPIGEGDTTTLHETLADTTAPTPRGSAIRRETRSGLLAAMSRLTPAERQVVEMYYGMNGGHTELNFPEIAKRFGVTRQCVSGQHRNALRKLKKFLGLELTNRRK